VAADGINESSLGPRGLPARPTSRTGTRRYRVVVDVEELVLLGGEHSTAPLESEAPRLSPL
jgi:hypothetical protein